MLTLSTLALAQADAQIFRTPWYFNGVFLLLFVAGSLAWLAATLLGFSRARAFGPATRWFALSAGCIFIYHLHFFVVGYGIAQRNSDMTFGLGAFLNLFVLAGAVCALIGFRQLSKPQP